MSFEKEFTEYNFPKLGFIKIPKFSISVDEITKLKLKENCTSDEYLFTLAKINFDKKIKNSLIPQEKINEYFERLEFEVSEISRLLFTDYILLVYDIINFCRKEEITNSPARGSCGGSLLLYVLDCIQIDPIKHGLLFERFISSSRTQVKDIDGELYISSATLPDVDIDSDQSLKYKINQFLEEKFPGKTAPICNLVSFQSRALLKEVLKCVDDFSEDQTKIVSNLIKSKHGKIPEISDELIENEEFKSWADKYPTSVKICQKLNGLLKNRSVHASGIIITNDILDDCIPIELSSAKGKVTGYNMDSAQEFGVKIDNLGLKNLKAIKKCLDLIGKKMLDIDINDPSIYSFLNTRNEFYGIFQAEDGMGKMVLKKLNCNCIDDLSISIAVGRPGSMRFIDEIVQNKTTGITGKLDPRIDYILKETYGVIIYQEQIMALCKKMTSFTPEETNQIRKIIGKKLKDEMPKWKEKFINQSLKNNYKKEIVDDIWQTFEESGDYLFNKCLSPDTIVETPYGFKMMFEINEGDLIRSFDIDSKKDVFVEVKKIFENNVELYEVELEDGRKIKCSMNHKFLTEGLEMIPLSDVLYKNVKVLCKANKLKTALSQSIKFIKKLGIQKTLDFQVDNKYHNFYAEGIVVSNSHATGYSYLTAITAYLKANHPKEFFLCLLNSAKDEQKEQDEIKKITLELNGFDLKLLPPNIFKSKEEFSIEDKGIRFGLSSIKGITKQTIEKLENFKHEFANKFDVFHAAEEAGVNATVLKHLIMVGALDNEPFSTSRPKLVFESELWKELTEREKKHVLGLGAQFSFDLGKIVYYLRTEKKDAKGKDFVIKNSRYLTLKNKLSPAKSLYDTKTNLEFDKWGAEKALLGFSYSSNLYDIFKERVRDLILISAISLVDDNEEVKFVGEVFDIKTGITKEKEIPYLTLYLQDHTGQITARVFNNEKYRNIDNIKELNGRLPLKDDIVIITGKKKENTVFITSLGIQKLKWTERKPKINH